LKAPATARAFGRGFTLIEITIVMVIIAILAGLITLSIGNRSADEHLQMEAQRLQQLVDLASEQAQLRSQQIGLELGAHEYRFLLLGKDRKWTVYTSDGSLRPRKLPAGYRIAIRVDDHDLPSSRRADRDDDDPGSDSSDKKKPEPQVMIYSSGEMTIFTVRLSVTGDPLSYQITSDALGHLKLKSLRGTDDARN
jgi:general secretion pathway protein H